MEPIRYGDLVRTTDGYYGLVWNIDDREVFLANGCMAVLPVEEWERLVVMPLNIFSADGARANFYELLDRPEAYRKVTPGVDWRFAHLCDND